jgi:large subunit ribosomal protein L30
MSSKKIKITLKKSSIGSKKNQIASLRGLGLRKINSFVLKESRPEILGMIKVVNHLVRVEEV